MHFVDKAWDKSSLCAHAEEKQSASTPRYHYPTFLALIASIPQRLYSPEAAAGCVPVGVAQGDAEVPGDGLQRGARDGDEGCDDDEDVDGRPAHDEDGDHHQDHAGDPAQVPVLLLQF